MGQAQFCGKEHERASKYGSIYVQPDRPHYYAGEQVTGKVYLMLGTMYPGHIVNLKLKGVEKTLIIWTESHTETDPHDHTKTTTVQHEKVASDKATCLYQKVNIYSFHGGQYLLPEQYEFPFSFKLPDNIPGTFHQHEYHLSASISYTIEAFLEPSDKSAPKLKYKNKFTVREPVREMVQSINKATETEIVCCCCKSYGTVGIKASFEKNTYCPSDEAHAIIQVDNSRCSKPMSDIRLELRQSITVKAQHKTETRSHEIVSRSIPGVGASESSEPRQASILLPPAPDLNVIFLKGDQHLKNPNSFNNKTINSTTNGVLIKSHFFLDAKATPDACCANSPVSSIPCHVVYPDYRFPIVQTPPNWSPQIMNPLNFSANLASQYAPQITINTNLGGGIQVGNNMGSNINVKDPSGYPGPTIQAGIPNIGVAMTTRDDHGYPGTVQAGIPNMGVTINATDHYGYPGTVQAGITDQYSHSGPTIQTGFPTMGVTINTNETTHHQQNTANVQFGFTGNFNQA